MAWWYDRNFENGVPHALIGMTLQEEVAGIWGDAAEDIGTDNRARIMISQPGPYRYRVKLTGIATLGANELGCAANEMLVYYALVAEDNGRQAGTPVDVVTYVRPE